MNRKQKIIVSITGIFIVLLALVGLTYGYFLTRITGNENEKSISVITANLELVYGDGNNAITMSNIMPGDPIPAKTFSVTNKGNDTVNNYKVYLESVQNQLELKDDLKYTLTCKQFKTSDYETWVKSTDENKKITDLEESGTCTGASRTTFPSVMNLIATNTINVGYTQYYELQLEYLYQNFDQSVDMGKKVTARINIYDENTILGDKPLKELSEILATTVLSPLNIQYDSSTTRANVKPFFLIPIEPGSTIEIRNNSSDFRYGVQTYASAYNLVNMTDTGWILPGESKVVNINSKYEYLGLVFGNAINANSSINIEDIDLSECIITYNGSDDNLLNSFVQLESAYESYSLKNYSANELNTYANNIEIIGHAGGNADTALKSTMSTIKFGVEEEGFDSVEVDVRVTLDNEFVLYHEEIISGMNKTIESSTLVELKTFKSDLLTLEEVLEYLDSKNAKIVLDIKTFPDSLDVANKLFNILESYNMENSFSFAQCPTNLLKNIPSAYSNITYTDYEYNTWNSSLIGKRVYYSMPIWELDLDTFVELLNAGHKYFEAYDYADTFTGGHANYYKEKISIMSYLCQQYNVNLRFSFYDNLSFNFSSITEKEMIKRLPKHLWDATDLIV